MKQAASTRTAALKRFVIVSEARTGSSFLCSSLDSHPEIVCHGEAYHPDRIWGKHGLETLDKDRRDADPVGFLPRIFEHAGPDPKIRAVGFKLHYRHQPLALDHILTDQDLKVVFLRRRNKLAQWASYRLANETGEWVKTAGEDTMDKAGPDQVTFRFHPFFMFLVHQADWEKRILRRRNTIYPVMYEHIVRPKGLDQVLDFLGVSRRADLSSDCRKQYTGKDTFGRFTNPATARWGAPLARGLAQAARVKALRSYLQSRAGY